MTCWAAFSQAGRDLALRLKEPGDSLAVPAAYRIEGCSRYTSRWAGDSWSLGEPLVIVGSCGLALRLIAPFVKDKTTDPAVVVIDETGRWVIPLLSGHLGGACDLAEELADRCGGQAVITTATDNKGLTAVDRWARRRGYSVANPQAIKVISAAQLAGHAPVVCAPSAVLLPPSYRRGCSGSCGVVLSPFCRPGPFETTLYLVPPVAFVGVGCRRGTTAEQLEENWQRFCAQQGLWPGCAAVLASVDLKENEEGLHRWAHRRRLPLRFFSAEELNGLEGNFSHSARVQAVAGVDCVCERAAAACGGVPVFGKWKGTAVTFAVSMPREWIE